MKNVLRLRICLASLAALASCLYVRLCSDIAVHMLVFCKIAVTSAVVFFISSQKYALAIPFAGFACALSYSKFWRSKFALLLPDILYGFAFVWIFFAMYLWLAQFSWRIDFFLNK